MATTFRWAACALALCAGLAWAQTAAPTLSVRLVSASKETGPSDARLNDVLPLLQNSGLKSFRLEDEQTLDLRDGATLALAKGYRLDLSQVQENRVLVRVSQNRRDLVQTRLSLAAGRPVIVVFDDPAGGKAIVILTLR